MANEETKKNEDGIITASWNKCKELVMPKKGGLVRGLQFFYGKTMFKSGMAVANHGENQMQKATDSFVNSEARSKAVDSKVKAYQKDWDACKPKKKEKEAAATA